MKFLEFHIFPPVIWSITLFLVILCSFPNCIFSDLQWYNTCGSYFNCGNINHVGFPFWGNRTRPINCGYPDLELTCEDNNVTILHIKDLRYHVLEINQNTHMLTLAREDFLQGVCLQKLVNTTLDYEHFGNGPDSQNITVLYGCPPPLDSYSYAPTSDVPGQFTCRISGVNDTIAYPVEGAIGPNGCYASVVVPVLNVYAAQIGKLSLGQVIGHGFEAMYKVVNESLVTDCVNSGGRIGFDSNETRCLCSDGSVGYSACGQPSASSSKSSKKGVAIGLSAGGVGLVAAALAFCFLVVKRKRRSLSEARSKEIMPSYPSTANPSSNDLRLSQGYTTSPSTYLTYSSSSYPSSKSDFENSADYFGIKVFPYSELEEATENFHESRELGDGGFGTVYYGKLSDGQLVAVKRLYENNCRHIGQFMNEIRILAHLRHKNLVTLYGCTSRRSRELLLVYEYVSNGTVADHLHGKLSQTNVLPWSIRLKIAVETAEALSFLHEKEIVHRDVKTTNILLDNTFQVKVADFGLSRLFPPDATHVSTAPQGTPGYVDPEYYQCYQLTEKSDVYSFGVVLAELMSSKVAVDITRHRHDIKLANMAVDRIQRNALDELIDPKLGFENDFFAGKIVKLLAEVVLQCLKQERDTRPSMKDVLESLKRIQKEMKNAQTQVVLDIHESDDVGLLKNVPPPVAPETRLSNTSIR